MSTSPSLPHETNVQPKSNIKLQYDNNNVKNKYSQCQQARSFITWYKQMIEHQKENLTLYLSDDVILEWFGRMIKTRKKVMTFIKYDMQCTKHYFTTVESIDKIRTPRECIQSKCDNMLPSLLDSPEMVSLEKESVSRKRTLRSNCGSPEWAEGCKPVDEISSQRKRRKTTHIISMDDEQNLELQNDVSSADESLEIMNKGDGMLKKSKRKYVPITPPNREVGQGDCLPSTSGTESDKSHDTLYAQLSKLAVECNGYIELTRIRNNQGTDGMKWDRKCKVQISYSEDPLNVGEYIIWALCYSDESKCRRNLLAAFEEVEKEENRKSHD